MEMNMNFLIDITDNNDNGTIYLDTLYDNKKIFEFTLDNTATVNFITPSIIAPENSVDFIEVIQ
jgi:hypothetical protein